MTRARVILSFPPEVVETPLTYRLITEYGFKVNILRASVIAGKAGRLLIEIEAPDEKFELGLRFIEEHGIAIRPLAKGISVNLEECTSCGSCTSVCSPGSLALNPTDFRLEFNPETCVACELCVPACPMKLIRVSFEDMNDMH